MPEAQPGTEGHHSPIQCSCAASIFVNHAARSQPLRRTGLVLGMLGFALRVFRTSTRALFALQNNDWHCDGPSKNVRSCRRLLSWVRDTERVGLNSLKTLSRRYRRIQGRWVQHIVFRSIPDTSKITKRLSSPVSKSTAGRRHTTRTAWSDPHVPFPCCAMTDAEF